MGVNIREKPKGSGVWWIFINHQSKRKSKKIGSKDIAKKVAEKVKAKLVLGELNIEKINRKCPTFKEYAEMWLSLPHDRKESTQYNYKGYLQGHIYPHIGSITIDKIRKKDLKLLFDKLSIKGLRLSTCRTIKIPLNGVLDHAVDSEWIDSNPLKNIKSGKDSAKNEVDPLTEKDAISLLDEMQKHRDGVFYPPVLCLLRTGIRIGELQALTWADVDFENRLIDINKTYWRGNISSTKNKKTRKVDMSNQLTEVLRELKQIQWKRFAGKNVPQWVFSEQMSNVLCCETLRRAINRCLEVAGLRHIRIHGLRHTYATTRLLKGHNIGDVSYQLGHSDIAVTYNTYTHWIPGKFKSEVDELDSTQKHPICTQKERVSL